VPVQPIRALAFIQCGLEVDPVPIQPGVKPVPIPEIETPGIEVLPVPIQPGIKPGPVQVQPIKPIPIPVV
jgi:hypothetical protein